MSRVVSFRVTDHEIEQIERVAARLGMAVSRYLRHRVLSPAPAITMSPGAVTTTCGVPPSAITWTWKAA